MANRFTDSRKWDDPWFRKLPCKYKAFFIFLLDKCNHAGIWKIDFESAGFHIGEKIDKGEAIKIMNGRIVELREKWFIPKFIEFQYQVGIKDLNPANRVHKSVLDILTKEGAYKGLTSPIQGCKDQDKDKDQDNKGGMGGFEEFWAAYPKPIGRAMALMTYQAEIKTERDFNNLMVALKNYMVSEEFKKGYIKNGSNWIEDWRGWVNQVPIKIDPLAKYEVKK